LTFVYVWYVLTAAASAPAPASSAARLPHPGYGRTGTNGFLPEDNRDTLGEISWVDEYLDWDITCATGIYFDHLGR
jgi:hypothetical protein